MQRSTEDRVELFFETDHKKQCPPLLAISWYFNEKCPHGLT